MSDNKKSYYAIIPANVRYDESLPPNAKLLYGEITALCNAGGYCWASNKYFADLYGVSPITISRWINILVNKGYISSRIIYKEAHKPGSEKAGKITREQIREIVQIKREDMNARSEEAAMRIIEGTARSMGIEVVDA